MCACVCAFALLQRDLAREHCGLHAVVAKTHIDTSRVPWLEEIVHQVLDTEVTNVPAAWKLNVAKVFSSLPYYYRAAYDTADVIRGHVLAGMVHHNGRDGNDFKVCLHTKQWQWRWRWRRW